MAYYTLDNPRLAYDYDDVSNAPVYTDYANDEITPGGLIEKANAGRGCDDDDYIYAS